MNENQNENQGFNRRDFLKGGSAATLMAMLGGVELFSNKAVAEGEEKTIKGPPIKVAVIGLGRQGREILGKLAVVPRADVAAICDNYPAYLRRCSSLAPKAKQVEDYKAILEDKEIGAVIVATPTHQHKQIVLDALQAGKHVYCEAPLANTLEDAKAIALAAKAVSKQQIFQPGLQLRADPQRLFLLPFIRSGSLGKFIMARAQWHKKISWRQTSPNAEREKALNWALYQQTSLGLLGELGIHQIDETGWFLGTHPKAITGFGSLIYWNQDKGDDRDVADTVQAVVEYPNDVRLTYDATLANSFDGAYEVFYGSDAAVMLRDSNAWMFKEVDAALLGWEVYAKKETFFKETGIVLKVGASKSAQPDSELTPEQLTKATPLYAALDRFLSNGFDLSEGIKNAVDTFSDDKEAAAEYVGKILAGFHQPDRSTPNYLDGYQATVTAIKANEAVVGNKRIELKPEWYELK
jgi:predicted dehydrogenase